MALSFVSNLEIRYSKKFLNNLKKIFVFLDIYITFAVY